MVGYGYGILVGITELGACSRASVYEREREANREKFKVGSLGGGPLIESVSAGDRCVATCSSSLSSFKLFSPLLFFQNMQSSPY